MGGLSRRKIHQSGPTTTIAFHPWVSSGSQALVGGTSLSKAMRQPVSVKWTFAALILASLVSGPIEVKAIGAEDGFSEDLNDKAYGYANTGVSADSTIAEDAIYNAREMRAPASRAFLRSLRSPPGQGGSMHFLRALRGHPSGTNMHFLRSLRSGDGRHFLRSLRSGPQSTNLHFLRSLRDPAAAAGGTSTGDVFPRTMKSAHFLRSLRSAEQLNNREDFQEDGANYDY